MRGDMGADIDKSSVERAYARWAPVYDLVFGAVFDAGGAPRSSRPSGIGGRILEVGVGTGISLPDYARTNRLVGIDLSEPMLRKAQERVAEHRPHQCRGAGGDGRRAAGAAGQILRRGGGAISSSPRCPIRKATLDEFARVIKPGGEIVLVNHIGAESGPRRLFEICFAPLARRLGWRPEFRFARLADWAERHGGVRVIERRADAAARAFLADPFRAPGRRRAPHGGLAHNPEKREPVFGQDYAQALRRRRPGRRHISRSVRFGTVFRRACLTGFTAASYIAPIPADSVSEWRGSSVG